MSCLFADVQKCLEIGIFSFMSYRRRSQLFACVGVLIGVLIGVRLASSLLVPQRTQLKLYVCLQRVS
jgi:hypothetical protein